MDRDLNFSGKIVPMSYRSMIEFAEGWIAAWNRRDVDWVLGHFADDAEFISPLAQKYSGSSSLIGKAALAPYWRTALENITALEFTLDHAIWDSNARELLVLYEANINGERKRACELMTFNSSFRPPD